MVVETGSRQKTSASAKHLPEDVLNDILSRLPIKSLLRFRCVSKSWLHLFSVDPHFKKLLHRNRPGVIALTLTTETPKLYYASDYTACDEAVAFDLPFHTFSSSLTVRYVILGICNGLICLSVTKPDPNLPNVYVWNPLTSHHITIPCPPVKTSARARECDYSFGFGFSEVSNQYKVIRLVWTWRKLCPWISIYTLGTDSWRTLEEIPYDFGGRDSNVVPFVNGALHWIVTKVALPSSPIIICFDVKHECFREIPLPNQVLDDNPLRLKVSEFDGLLSVICMHSLQNVRLWVMKVCGVEDSWIKQCEIELLNAPYIQFDGFEPLGFASDREIIANFTFQGLSLYNSESSSITKLKEFEEYVDDAFIYHGRLTSLNGYHGFIERMMRDTRNKKTVLMDT